MDATSNKSYNNLALLCFTLTCWFKKKIYRVHLYFSYFYFLGCSQAARVTFPQLDLEF